VGGGEDKEGGAGERGGGGGGKRGGWEGGRGGNDGRKRPVTSAVYTGPNMTAKPPSPAGQRTGAPAQEATSLADARRPYPAGARRCGHPLAAEVPSGSRAPVSLDRPRASASPPVPDTASRLSGFRDPTPDMRRP